MSFSPHFTALPSLMVFLLSMPNDVLSFLWLGWAINEFENIQLSSWEYIAVSTFSLLFNSPTILFINSPNPLTHLFILWYVLLYAPGINLAVFNTLILES